MNIPDERVIVIRNPVSSYGYKVQHDVVDRLIEGGVTKEQLVNFCTPSADSGETIEKLSEIIRPGDNVIVAAGDGTGNVGVNAIMQADKDGSRIGFLSYGNFSDMAATFTGPRAQRDPIRLLTSSHTIDVRPLNVIKNGDHYRYALLYANLGWTAQAAAAFDDPDIRQALQRGETSLADNLFRFAKIYFKTRSTAELPAFRLNDDEVPHTKVTDVLAVNGPIMGRIIRSGKIYYDGDTFFSCEMDVSSFTPNIPFLGRSALNMMLKTHLKLPGSKEVSHLDLTFENNPNIPLHIDGENSFGMMRTLSIAKDSRDTQTVRVISTLEDR
jgi:diacylglycerol kinase family enzyme